MLFIITNILQKPSAFQKSIIHGTKGTSLKKVNKRGPLRGYGGHGGGKGVQAGSYGRHGYHLASGELFCNGQKLSFQFVFIPGGALLGRGLICTMDGIMLSYCS